MLRNVYLIESKMGKKQFLQLACEFPRIVLHDMAIHMQHIAISTVKVLARGVLHSVIKYL